MHATDLKISVFSVIFVFRIKFMVSKKIYIFALAAHGLGISGGDRIFIEFARRWVKDALVKIFVSEEGYQMCQRQKLRVSGINPSTVAQGDGERIRTIKYQVSSMEPWRRFGFVINYLARIIEGIKIGLTLRMEENTQIIIYSASEFWMDCLPAFFLKLRFKKIKWVAAWYQTAPNPLKGFSEGERRQKYHFKAFVYWLFQQPVKFLIGNYADFVLVNNEEEKKQFPALNHKGNVLVVLGAVDIKAIKKWRVLFKNSPKVYDAVFQGRFHPQKGVLELIDLWKIVVNKKIDAKLIMIGDGPLMEKAKLKIKSENLERNIKLTGYLFDGEEKYRIFSQSKLVVHPAFYDSGGMAAAEAMAFGLPAIGFDLKSFQSYYPRGMVKVKIGDLKLFAKTILELLDNKDRRDEIGKNALNMINMSWSWEKRAQDVLKVL